MNSLIVTTLVLGFFDLVAVVSAKFWTLGKGNWLFFLSVASFTTAGIFFAHGVKYNSMAIVNIAWIAVSVIFVTLIDYFYFKENISLTQLIGMTMVVVGFVLINLKN